MLHCSNSQCYQPWKLGTDRFGVQYQPLSIMSHHTIRFSPFHHYIVMIWSWNGVIIIFHHILIIINDDHTIPGSWPSHHSINFHHHNLTLTNYRLVIPQRSWIPQWSDPPGRCISLRKSEAGNGWTLDVGQLLDQLILTVDPQQLQQLAVDQWWLVSSDGLTNDHWVNQDGSMLQPRYVPSDNFCWKTCSYSLSG